MLVKKKTNVFMTKLLFYIFSEDICGEKTPSRTFKSSGRNLTLKFQSDSLFRDDGFKLIFTAFHPGNFLFFQL